MGPRDALSHAHRAVQVGQLDVQCDNLAEVIGQKSTVASTVN